NSSSPGARNAQQSQRWVTVLDSNQLRGLRRQHGLPQEQLAVKAGISQSTVARLESRPGITCSGREVAVGGPWLAVELLPGTEVTLTLRLRLRIRVPSAQAPWDAAPRDAAR
ncbi:MAG: helix-turn-helix transcriptional regulator, partial [Streptosporangiaceae bacterium]